MSLDSRDAQRRREAGTSLGQLGVVVVLVSISVIFIAASLAVLITNHQAASSWRAGGRHELPWGTLASTAALVVVSWRLQSALVAIRNNRFTHCLNGWRQAGAAAMFFLFAQALNVRRLAELEGVRATQTLFLFCYDLLVGLHALHVIGGFVPLVWVHAKLMRQDYSSSRHDGVTFCVQYWHYLGLVWLLLLGVLAWVG